MSNNDYWVRYGRHIVPTLVTEENTQNEQRDMALQKVNQFGTCLDIGSNVGMWTRELANRFENVYCFEPNPSFIECFRKNIHEHNVTLFEVGLSDREHTASQDATSTILSNTAGDIQCRTLDSYKFDNIDFIKIDVDGFELQLLNGAIDTLTRNTPVINIEMKNKKRPGIVSKCAEIMTVLGYSCQSRVKSDEVWAKK